MSRCDAPRFARPSALRAAPSGTGLSTRGHQRGRQGAARKPLEHGTGYHRFHLKNANPWSKNGVRRNLNVVLRFIYGMGIQVSIRLGCYSGADPISAPQKADGLCV